MGGNFVEGPKESVLAVAISDWNSESIAECKSDRVSDAVIEPIYHCFTDRDSEHFSNCEHDSYSKPIANELPNGDTERNSVTIAVTELLAINESFRYGYAVCDRH